MTERTGAPERRRYARIAPKGTVVLHAAGHAQRGRIANLGHGGVFAWTKVTAPDRLLARTVDVELRLDGNLARWLRASGRIIRIAAEGVAIAFSPPPDELIQAIDEMSAPHPGMRAMAVVLVDADPERRASMAIGFRAAGCKVVEAARPLDAIVALGESSFEPDLIAIADSVPGTVADELRVWVERNHPRARLVTIGADELEPIGTANWLSAADPLSDLPARVLELMDRPRRA